MTLCNEGGAGAIKSFGMLDTIKPPRTCPLRVCWTPRWLSTSFGSCATSACKLCCRSPPAPGGMAASCLVLCVGVYHICAAVRSASGVSGGAGSSCCRGVVTSPPVRYFFCRVQTALTHHHTAHHHSHLQCWVHHPRPPFVFDADTSGAIRALRESSATTNTQQQHHHTSTTSPLLNNSSSWPHSHSCWTALRSTTPQRTLLRGTNRFRRRKHCSSAAHNGGERVAHGPLLWQL